MLWKMKLWQLCLLGVVVARPQLETSAEKSDSKLPAIVPVHKTADNYYPSSDTSHSFNGNRAVNTNQHFEGSSSEIVQAEHGLRDIGGQLQNVTLEKRLRLETRLEHNEQVVTLKPLPTLKSLRKSKILHSGARHKDFILKLAEEFSQYDEPAEGGGTRNGFAMGIVPSDAQIAAWKIDNIPIGATGYWIPWYRTPLPEDERAYVYRMYGLEGCTATIIVTSQGFWAGHLWESTNPAKVNGGSSFKERFSSAKGDVAERTDEVFKKIAVDILDEPSPEGSYDFQSLKDIKTWYPGVFDKHEDLYVLVLTKAKSATNDRQQYRSKIRLLTDAYKRALPGLTDQNLKVLTYPGTKEIARVSGTITLQYTPYEEYDSGDVCWTYSKVRVWVEDRDKPVIEHSW